MLCMSKRHLALHPFRFCLCSPSSLFTLLTSFLSLLLRMTVINYPQQPANMFPSFNLYSPFSLLLSRLADQPILHSVQITNMDGYRFGILCSVFVQGGEAGFLAFFAFVLWLSLCVLPQPHFTLLLIPIILTHDSWVILLQERRGSFIPVFCQDLQKDTSLWNILEWSSKWIGKWSRKISS